MKSNNRVKAITGKFERLNSENDIRRNFSVRSEHLCNYESQLGKCNNTVTQRAAKPNDPSKQNHLKNLSNLCVNVNNIDFSVSANVGTPNVTTPLIAKDLDSEINKPTTSQCGVINKLRESVTVESNTKNKLPLSRQSSDPGRRLQRSHAFRCDRSQLAPGSPKRHSSCSNRHKSNSYCEGTPQNSLTEDSANTSTETIPKGKEGPKLTEERLKKLTKAIQGKMEKDTLHISIPDSCVPQHILDQYAKVNKKRNNYEKQDAMTDSGVSSETENLEEDQNKIKRLKSRFEPPEKSHSSETIKLERKNPHVDLTDTLKKALKQPLPAGPPPKKPPRVVTPNHKEKARHMLEKLELALKKRENQHIYDIAETDDSKDLHYLSTEILTIKTSPQNSLKNCLNFIQCNIDPYVKVDNKTIEHIYDIPCTEDNDSQKSTLRISDYGQICLSLDMPSSNLKKNKLNSKSLENLQQKKEEIYATPDILRSVNTNFERILRNFEARADPPPPHPPVGGSADMSKPSGARQGARESSEWKREGRFQKNRFAHAPSAPCRPTQVEEDKENLNRLMNEIYDTVTAASTMGENGMPNKFPNDNSDAGSEDSIKLTRSLTDKRKNYVRRVSSRVAYLEGKNVKYRNQTSVCSLKSQENPYSTFRSWKSFRHSQSKEKVAGKMADKMADAVNVTGASDSKDHDSNSLDDKTGCLDISFPFVPRENGLFDVCLLVGLNCMTGKAYVKSVYPKQVTVPPHIENLVFPETLNSESESRLEYDLDPSRTQNYSLVLTDEKGNRSYGYCRRVLPEGTNGCLPLAYCMITRCRSPGFYYKILTELESHHGSSDVEIHTILKQLFETDFPHVGQSITLKYITQYSELKRHALRKSVHLGDLKSNTLSIIDAKKSRNDDSIPEFYDIENNNHSEITNIEACKLQVLKRSIEPRIDEDNLSILLDSLGASMTVKVFATLLLERKVVLISDNLSQLSSCIEALQFVLYPFVWQQPLISTIPSELKQEILEAPLPILAGMLKAKTDVDWNLEDTQFEEGMLIELSSPPKVIFSQGDESTILPSASYKTLKGALQMELSRSKDSDRKTRNIMISEAFLRFFVEVLTDFAQFFKIGAIEEGDLGKGDVVFEKDKFISNTPTKHVQYFLEWFTESAMFSHFIQNMASYYGGNATVQVVDAPLPNFYQLFEERSQKREVDKSDKVNYKSAMNKKVKLLKSKLKELVT